MTLRRPDGSWIFHFVNVVDDITMNITHVIRGEDHLSNTPKHQELYKALGATPPHFAHMPLILNRDGTKMSKRDEGASFGTYPEEGYAPEALRNYLCLLGWSPKDNREILDMQEILSLFDLPQINRRSASFDKDKCFWMNGQYLLHMDLGRYAELARPFLDKAGFDCEDWNYLEKVLTIVKPKVKMLHDLPQWVCCFFTDDFPFEEAAVAKSLRVAGAGDRLKALAESFATSEPWNAATIEVRLKETAATLGVKIGELIHPARVAVSGRSVGPGLYEMFEVLGRDKTVKRLCSGAEMAEKKEEN
jgi:glutamyl-tRNA synthetase